MSNVVAKARETLEYYAVCRRYYAAPIGSAAQRQAAQDMETAEIDARYINEGTFKLVRREAYGDALAEQREKDLEARRQAAAAREEERARQLEADLHANAFGYYIA